MTEYPILDASGTPVAIHRRIEGDDGKRFTWSLPDGTSGLAGFPVADLPLYGIHRAERRSVILTEGEKSAQALMDVGMTAVGSVTGAASAPSPKALAALAGKAVYLWPDADDPGRTHMSKIAAHLAPIAASVQWIEPPADSPKGWDAVDALAEGGRELVESLVRGASPWAEPMLDVPIEEQRYLAGLMVDGLREMHSSGPDGGSERKELRCVTARQLAAQSPEDVAWIAPPWIASGAITELDGRPKAAGKTTFLLHLVRAVLDGGQFLGQHTMRTPVVLLSEQGPMSLRATLERARLLERDDLYIVLWRDVRGTSWPSVVDGAVALCAKVGASLLIVDTLPQFAAMVGDSENDAGAALEAMEPLQAAAAHGLGIVVSRHDRKAGGDVGESGRGSSAFAGAVDIVLALRRGDGESRATIRHLHALSRFEETPDELVIELTDAGYAALGSAINFAVEEAKRAVLAALAGEPLTTAQIVEATALKRTTIYAALAELVEAGTLGREGKGNKGDPFRYFTVASVSPDPIPSGIGPDERIEANGEESSEVDMTAAALHIFGAEIASIDGQPVESWAAEHARDDDAEIAGDAAGWKGDA